MKLIPLFLIAATLLVFSFSTKAQNNKDSAKIAHITQLIHDQNYVFKAQDALPTGARMRHLTSEYDLQVSKDKVQSYLPYIGRAYSATIGSSESPLEFTSTDFEYKVVPNKKGDGWEITIKCKDYKEKPNMQLSVFNNGSASLHVVSVNRQPISFNGYIDAPIQKKK